MPTPAQTATTFIDPDLDRNVRYTYRVKAINGDKIGSWSNLATSLYFAPKHVTQPNTPAAPHSLESVSTHGGIELTWEPPNGEEGIVGYRILRQRPEECEKSYRVHVENTGSTATTFVDEDVEVGTKYTYRVKAINAEGHGVWSGYTSTRRGLVEVIMMSSQDHHSITKGTKTQFQVSASHLSRDNDPSTVDYILRGDVTETEGGANVDSCEDANLGTDISISVVDSVSVQYGGTFGGPGCTAGNYTVTYVVTEADTGNRLAGTVFYYDVKSSLDVGSLLPNNLAKGLPTISGTAQVGNELTAQTSGISDADGLDNVDYSYQWIGSNGNSDTDIEDATDSTYTPSPSDVGKTIKVKVSFTDDADNDETLTSEATVAVAATVPSAPQSLTVTSGSQTQELDVTWQVPSSNGGSAVTGYKVQWKEAADSWDTEADVSEATETGTTYTITSLTGGVEYAVRVIATNDVGDGPASTEARATPADSPTSGEEGTETVESDSTAALTATMTVGVLESGSEKVWGYDWFTGTLDQRTYSEGDQTIEVMAVLLSNGFVALTVRPHPSVDFVLTADGTEFASADASEVKSQTLISYVWAATLDWAKDDRVALSLTLKDTDSTEQSEPAEQSEPVENTPATGFPTISGTSQVEETLTADTSPISDEDGLTNVSYRYQWIADGTDIEGATGSSYELTSNEQGQTIQVRVSFTDDRDNAETLTSEATVAVAPAAGVPEKPRAVRVFTGPNHELDVDWKPPTSGGEAPITSYTVQWRHDDEDYDVTPGSTRQAVITDVSDLTHTINDLTKEGIHYVQVIATNSMGDGPASSQVGARRNTAPPEITCVEVSRSTLSLSYNKDLDNYATPPASSFVVTVGGVAREVTNVEVINWYWPIHLHSRPRPCDWKDPEVKLELAEPVKRGDEVEVSYAAPEDPSARRIQDEAGQPAASFVAQPATNKTKNWRARGLPTVNGTAQVGETLTASTVDIYDYDGLEHATFTYQWIANDGTNDTDIEGAIDSAYELTGDEAGKAVKVQVSYTDDDGFLETLTSAATGTVAATAAPGGPQSVVVSPGGIQELEVSWEAPSDVSGSPVTGYKVQWKSGDQDYDSSREAVVTGLSHTVSDLTEDVQHIVRVVTVHGDQDGSASPGVSATPLSGEKTLLRFIENDIVATYGADYPWLRTVLEVLRRPGYLEVNHDYSSQGRVEAYCDPLYEGGSGDNSAPLQKCHVSGMWIHPDHITDKYTIVHEMAHIYTVRSGLPANPGRVAMAHLYFADLQSQWEPNQCPTTELHADVLSMLTLGDDTGADSSYWRPCNGDNTARTQRALSVVRSAVAGQTPQWFADTYNDSQGTPDLEQVWSDVKAVPLSLKPIAERINVASDLPKAVVVYQLRNEFGGYCDGEKASESAFWGGTTRNPWRDGGCVPVAPGTLTASAGEGQVSLSWETPAYDGGSPIASYLVRWKSGSQEFDILRQESVTDPAVLTHTVSGLTNGVEYTLQVQAYNHNGGGAVSEVTATPFDATAPQLLATVVSASTLTLTYNEALDENSVPNRAPLRFRWEALNGESVGFRSRVPKLRYPWRPR